MERWEEEGERGGGKKTRVDCIFNGIKYKYFYQQKLL
jgi:hypothetical protein